MRLDGKVALITGAARGIGRATARAFAREGAHVVVADLNIDGAKDAVGELTAKGGRASALAVDVSDAGSIAGMFAEIERSHGKLHALVNNAGVGGNTLFLNTTLEEWERIIKINLTGAFLVAQGAARLMIKSGGGRIVNIASLSGQRGGTGRSAYGAAKAGLELLTKVMSVELPEHNITVNAIAPGPIETEMAKFAHDRATRSAYEYLVPMHRYGTPEEIADAAVFLCSDESRYVNGHTLNVDGGFLGAGLMFKPDTKS